MAEGNRIVKDQNLTVDGINLIGKLKSVTPPNVRPQVEFIRPGGSQGQLPVNMGLQQLDYSFTLFDYNPEVLALSGLRNGRKVTFIQRLYLEDEAGTEYSVIMSGTGMVVDVDRGSIENGAIPETSYSLVLVRYNEEIDGATVYDIDITPGSRKQVIDNTDQLQNAASILGLGIGLAN